MHAIQPDPRRLLAAVGAALVLTVAALALPTAAGDLDVRLGGGPRAAEPARAPVVARPAPAPPRWVADPLSPPGLAAR